MAVTVHLRGGGVPGGRGGRALVGEASRAWTRTMRALEQLRAAGRDIAVARARLAAAREAYLLQREAALRIWSEEELLAARVPGLAGPAG